MSQGLQPGVLNQSGANQFYSSGIAASQLNGTGSHVQTNKLNRKGAGPNVVVVPGPVKVVEQPVEVIKTVKRKIPAARSHISAAPSTPVVEYKQLEPNLRNLIAETSAKISLLVMENNRIKWRVAQRDAEIARLRGGNTGGVRVSQTVTNVPVSHVVTQGAPVSTYPSAGVVRTSGGYSGNTIRPSGTTYTTGAPTTYTTGAPTTTQGGVVRTQTQTTHQTTTLAQPGQTTYQPGQTTNQGVRTVQPGTQPTQIGGQRPAAMDESTKGGQSFDDANDADRNDIDDQEDRQMSDDDSQRDSTDDADKEAKRELKRLAKEERKKKLEEEKKEKRKAKKQAKDEKKRDGVEGGKEGSKTGGIKKGKAGKVAEKSEEISEKVPGEQNTEEQLEADLIEVEAKDEINTAFKVGKETVVVQNSELEKLEAVRKQRERDERERLAEQKKKELMKEKTKSELEKLQEKLALKNELKNKKALPPHDPELEGPTILQGTYISQRNVEPAGDIYELYLMKRLGLLDDSESDNEEEKEDPAQDEGINKEKLNEKRKKANKDDIMKKMLFKNHYHALGLESKQFEATVDDIRKAYKMKVLSHHPDKFEEGAYDESAKQQWLSIQDAYETLVDADKKRRYDSTMEFDDSIPENRDFEEEEFFTEFAACFGRNSAFSEKQPVPKLGDMKTPIGKVIKFYEFWTAFRSWRDFTVEDEYDLDQAENRYERRYMERENKHMKKDLLKKEKARIKKLVDLAKSKDPRIVKHEKEERERVERQREEKRLEKVRRREEEIKRKADIEEAERLKKQAELDAIRKREEEVKAVKMAKKDRLDQIKALVGKKVDLPEYGRTFLDFFFDGVFEEEQNAILKILNEQDDTDILRQKFRDFVAAVKERQSPQKKAATFTPKDNKKALLDKWSDDEIALLTKGILKFPAGTGGRWDKIAALIGGTKNIHEVTEMAKELSIKNVRGEKNIISTMENVIKEKANIAENPTPKPQMTISGQEGTPVQAVEWSQPQQRALEQAMKQYPASMDKKERWTKIAEAIPGKTPKQCLDRVKEIKEKLAKKA